MNPDRPPRRTPYSNGQRRRPRAALHRPRVHAAGLDGPPGRAYRYRPARRRSPYPLATVVVALVGCALIIWSLMWDGSDRGATAAPDATSAEAAAEREPTAAFATFGDLELRLPVDPAEMTALAFHQAAGTAALPMTSLVPEADMELAAEVAAPSAASTAEVLAADGWAGTCLRLWRSNRSGEPDTAADVGADPGTPVWSPVTGTVVAVRPYRLYGKHDDFEIHIRPDGHDDIDVVLIHVDAVVVEAGDRVLAGATRIASVRLISDKMDLQLGGYTTNGGDHVHLQLNRIETPGVLQGPQES